LIDRLSLLGRDAAFVAQFHAKVTHEVVSVGVIHLEIMSKLFFWLTLSEQVRERDSARAILGLFIISFPDVNTHYIVLQVVCEV